MSILAKKTKTKTEKAISIILKGYMCSESVVMAYAKDFGIEPKIAAKISSGFAGGMAHGKTCGAVTGSLMVIGLKYGTGLTNDQYSRDICSQLTQEFFHRFIKRRDTVECGKILLLNGINPKHPEEMKKLREKKLCDKIVKDAVEILEELFIKNDS